MNIYAHQRSEATASSVHSLIREYYPQEYAGKYVGYETAEYMCVLSPVPPMAHQGLQFERSVDTDLAVEGTYVRVKCLVSFGNRGSKLKDGATNEYGGHYKVIRQIKPLEARQKFCELTGLEELQNKTRYQGVNCRFMGARKTPKFHLYNVFLIEGEYIVRDEEMFERALLHGIGSRKSYGFGLLFCEPLIKEKEDESYEDLSQYM